MKTTDRNSVADIDFRFKWHSEGTAHIECYRASHVNFWRDFFPESLFNGLQNRQAGDTIEIQYDSGKIISEVDPRAIFRVRQNQFDRRYKPDWDIAPRMGRFYPKGILKDVTGVFPQNIAPFRCVEIQNGHLDVDFNHPLAGKGITLSATVQAIQDKSDERGGTSRDWIETVSTGPGMQARWNNRATDYFSDDPFAREDATPDKWFYREPRFVQHIDNTAIQVIEKVYTGFLREGMRVLDLMSSWTSHLPDRIRLEKLSGLGLNREELERNTQLTDWVVHDLNKDPTLPFGAGLYDMVLCTVSVEYLIHPVAVFEDIARVLRPGGVAIVTFSNRWFPPKVTKIWKELHEFERMGLVLEYFRKCGKFKDMETYSMRGLPRPRDDKYYPEFYYSDPVFAVWGRRV